MRKLVAVLGLAAAIILALPNANACGDKLMALGRGVRFQRAYRTPHPAAILIYMRPNSRAQEADKKLLLQSTLVAAGHRIQTVQDPARLAEALQSGRFDLVMTDPADAASLEAELPSSPSKPIVVPVLYKPTKAEESAAESRYHWVVRAPSQVGQLLMTIDSAMDVKLRNSEGAVAKKM